MLGIRGRRMVGAEVEQLVLDAREHRGFAGAFGQGSYREADPAVRFVDVADGCHQRCRLGDARAVDEAGRAGIAGARVDLVELDHQGWRLAIWRAVDRPTSSLRAKRKNPSGRQTALDCFASLDMTRIIP